MSPEELSLGAAMSVAQQRHSTLETELRDSEAALSLAAADAAADAADADADADGPAQKIKAELEETCGKMRAVVQAAADALAQTKRDLEAFHVKAAAAAAAASPPPPTSSSLLSTSPGVVFVPLSSAACTPADKSFDALSKVTVPKYVYNDYLQRIPAAQSFKVVSGSPGVALLPPNTVLPAMPSCPASLHGFYTALSLEESAAALLTFRVFSPDEAAAVLSPAMSFDDRSGLFTLSYASGANAFNVAPSASGRGYKSGVLSSSSGVFVPSGHAVSFKSSSVSAVAVLRFCFADASNLNAVKAGLRARSFADEESGSILRTVSSPKFDNKMERMANHVAWKRFRVWPRAVEEDAAAAAAAADAAAAEDGDADEKSTKRTNRKARKNKNSFGDWQTAKAWDHRVLGLTLPTLDTPDVVASGRQNVTLAWSCPFQLKEGDSAVVSFVVSWEGVLPDDSKVSGNATYAEKDKHGQPTNQIRDGSFSVVTGADSKSKGLGIIVGKYTAVVKGLDPGARYYFRVALQYGNDAAGGVVNAEGIGRGDDEEVAISLFSHRSKLVKTLQRTSPQEIPGSPASVSPKLWDSVLGDPLRNAPFRPTHGSDATMVILVIKSPCDDGGLPVEGYDVLFSHVDASDDNANDWKLLPHGVEVVKVGGVTGAPNVPVYVAIHHLMPGRKYQFQIAARNSHGRSYWSSRSDIVSTMKGKPKESVEDDDLDSSHGYVPPGGHLLHGIGSGPRLHADHVSKDVRCVLDDAAQTLAFAWGNAKKTVDVWTSFWSPRGFLASGELVGVEEIEGMDGAIANHKDLDHRIAVVKRGGGVPLVKKAEAAQKAGAIALVILDDGKCEGIYDQYCVRGASKALGELWGELDPPRLWQAIHIPVVLLDAKMLAETGIAEASIYWSGAAAAAAAASQASQRGAEL